MTTPTLESLVTAERRIRSEIRFDPAEFHAAKNLVDNAFVGLPGTAAAYVREVFTMIEHDASATYGRAFVESWTDHAGQGGVPIG
jgi:hypothetical protein